VSNQNSGEAIFRDSSGTISEPIRLPPQAPSEAVETPTFKGYANTKLENDQDVENSYVEKRYFNPFTGKPLYESKILKERKLFVNKSNEESKVNGESSTTSIEKAKNRRDGLKLIQKIVDFCHTMIKKISQFSQR